MAVVFLKAKSVKIVQLGLSVGILIVRNCQKMIIVLNYTEKNVHFFQTIELIFSMKITSPAVYIADG